MYTHQKPPKRLSDLKEGIDGIEFLRQAVRMLDGRAEHLNENKTPTQLLNDVLRALNERTTNYYFFEDRQFTDND